MSTNKWKMVDLPSILLHRCVMFTYTFCYHKNKAHVDQQNNEGLTSLILASSFGQIEVCECLLQANTAIDITDDHGEDALFYAVRNKQYKICKLLMQHGTDINNLGYNGKSILEVANATRDETIISLVKQYQNKETLSIQIEETRKQLKKLQIQQIIKKKEENLAEIEKARKIHDELKKLLLEKQKEKASLEAQVEFLIEDINTKSKRLGDLKTEYKRIKPLLEKQGAECKKQLTAYWTKYLKVMRTSTNIPQK